MLATLSTGLTIVAEPITPANFARFGGVISSREQLATAEQSSANQGTARKLLDVSPVVCTNSSAHARWNLFRCSPPLHLIADHTGEDDGCTYVSRVLERHPHSTQTFVPMGRGNGIAYMVIVATSRADAPHLPNLVPNEIKAFTVRGDQAVTYNANTWHAPMIALGEITDFAVFIHETGDNAVDTEEVAVDELQVEFTLTMYTDPVQRKEQTEAEFAAEQERYKDGPPLVRAADASGDARFDVKQLKYAIERAYFHRNDAEVLALCAQFPTEHKLHAEVSAIADASRARLGTVPSPIAS